MKSFSYCWNRKKNMKANLRFPRYIKRVIFTRVLALGLESPFLILQYNLAWLVSVNINSKWYRFNGVELILPYYSQWISTRDDKFVGNDLILRWFSWKRTTWSRFSHEGESRKLSMTVSTSFNNSIYKKKENPFNSSWLPNSLCKQHSSSKTMLSPTEQHRKKLFKRHKTENFFTRKRWKLNYQRQPFHSNLFARLMMTMEKSQDGKMELITQNEQ